MTDFLAQQEKHKQLASKVEFLEKTVADLQRDVDRLRATKEACQFAADAAEKRRDELVEHITTLNEILKRQMAMQLIEVVPNTDKVEVTV